MRADKCLLLLSMMAFTSGLSAQDLVDSSGERSVAISGMILMNAHYSDDLVNDRAAPWMAAPRNPISGDRREALGGTVSQSVIRVSARASRVLGGCAEGLVEVDFFGKPADEHGRRANPRIRRAVGRIRWPHAWIVFGQTVLPVSPLQPSSYSTVGIPGFTGAGNLSRWLPQVRLGMEAGAAVRLGLEVAAVAPRFDPEGEASTSPPDFAEQSRRPYTQGRLVARWGSDGTEGEVGVGGHYGWFTYGWVDAGTDSLGVTRAATASARLFVARFLEFRSEAFLGEGLGILGGGGIDQSIGPDGSPVRTKGGWAQLNVHPSSHIELGGGYGFDDPEDEDLDPVDGRKLNVSWEVHGHLELGSFLAAVQYRRLETTYADAVFDLQTANHVSVALGLLF